MAETERKRIPWSLWIKYVLSISAALVIWAAIGSHGTGQSGYYSYTESGYNYIEYPGADIFQVVAPVLILFAIILFFVILKSQPKQYRPQFIVIARSFCDKCGYGLNQQSIFCPNCGKHIR